MHSMMAPVSADVPLILANISSVMTVTLHYYFFVCARVTVIMLVLGLTKYGFLPERRSFIRQALHAQNHKTQNQPKQFDLSHSFHS